jgi:acetyl esterase/lipase
MAIDQATAALLEQLIASGAPPLHEMNAQDARCVMALLRGDAPPGPDMAEIREQRVQASGGFVPVRVFVPEGQPRAVIVYYHGGGWVIGSVEDYDATTRLLAQRTGSVVVSVDYRLAPEYRFPVAVDDSWAALLWANERIEELAGARVPLIIAGDSAGGNLAAIMAQRAKAAASSGADSPAIALQVLVYPVTDCDLDTTSYLDPANQLLLSRDSMVWFWDHYAPVPEARVHPDASPLRQVDLKDLPPAVVLTAEHDPLRDEGELYATRLVQAGVLVRHQRFEGQMHGFFTMNHVLPGADVAMDYVTAAIDNQLAGDRAKA